MTSTEIIAVLEQRFGDKLKDKKADAIDPFVTVDGVDLVEVCKFLKNDTRLKFEMLPDMTGVDYLETDAKKLAKAGFEPHLEVLYHLQSFTNRNRFTLKVVLPRWKADKVGELPDLPSVAGVWNSADWLEREIFDLLGINFVGHPSLDRILLSEDWEGHPLRKDYEFPLEYHGIRGR